MRTLSIIIFFIITASLNAQQIEIFGGSNYNIFHDYNDDGSGHYRGSFKSKFGFSAGIGLDSIRIDWMTFRFTLQFDQYKGEFEVGDGGLGGDYTTKAKINKSIFTLGVFPVNIRFIKKRLHLNLGLEMSRFLTESVDGTASGWYLSESHTSGQQWSYINWSYKLNEKFSRYSSLMYFGFIGRISYDIPLSKSIELSPQYSYYYGFSNEFVEFPEKIKSKRHNFLIGIKKRI